MISGIFIFDTRRYGWDNDVSLLFLQLTMVHAFEETLALLSSSFPTYHHLFCLI